MEAGEERVQQAVERRLALVDCDVHPHFRRGITDLAPYLAAGWRERVGFGQGSAWAKELYAARFTLPVNVLYINSAGVMRRDATAEDGSAPGSDPPSVVRQLLDAHSVDRAVLIGGNVFGLGAVPDADLAAAVASAYNDWLCDKWLAHDRRFRGALTVAPQDPAQAAAEIDRAGDRAGMVEVFLPLMNRLMGDRHYYPIYEAAARHDLPVGLHPNSVDGIFTTAPAMAGAAPTYYIEWHAGLTQVFQANLISLLSHGVFERFPNLKVVIHEGGVAWLIDVLWRLDKNWRALRDEVPWVKHPPSEYVSEHVRLTTQPFLEPRRPEHLLAVCEMVDAERTLLFSSDYPHWDFDDPLRALAPLPPDLRRRIQADNAVALYGERLR